MKWLGAVAALLAIILFPPTSQARPYIGVHGGLNILQDSDLDDTTGFLTVPIEVSFDNGGTIGGVGGFAFPFGLRVEGEITYRTNAIEQGSIVGFPIPMSGDVESLAVMANVWYDLLPTPVVKPYVGVGIGLVSVATSGVIVNGVPFAADDDTVFGAQIGLGVAVEVIPKVAITGDYRFLFTDRPEFTNLAVEADYISHSFRIGLRYSF